MQNLIPCDQPRPVGFVNLRIKTGHHYVKKHLYIFGLVDSTTCPSYELTTEELQEILNEEHQERHRNVSPSEQKEDERGPMLTSAIKDLLKKWDSVRAMVLKWHRNQADVSRVGDLYNDNAINYFRKILKKRQKQSTLDMFFNAP
ncbi:uncharacterized protein TNCV_406071 [Trichonephila clavipes]|nr:uncharacterized protein TNCV_406071 [Trichonephila clavipes]